jgi:hypothetical protein
MGAWIDPAADAPLVLGMAGACAALAAWAAMRFAPRPRAMAALAAGLCLAGGVLPPWDSSVSPTLDGRVAGEAWLRLVAEPGSAVRVSGGEGSLDGQVAHLACAANCTFRIGEAQYGHAGARLPASPSATLTGYLRVTQNDEICTQRPLLAWLVPWHGPGCGACEGVTYEASSPAPRDVALRSFTGYQC